MKDPDNKDVIKQMKEVLHTYEEPYLEGAWEEFTRKQKSGLMPFWRWTAVAASILVVGSIWLLSTKQPVNSIVHQVVKRKAINAPPSPQHKERDKQAAEQIEQSDRQLAVVKQRSHSQQSAVSTSSEIVEAILEKNIGKQPERLTYAQVQADEAHPQFERSVKLSNDRFLDFLVTQGTNEDKEKITKKTGEPSSASNWDFGVEILPTLSDAALNLGAGLTTQYKLSDHFSVGSGISYVELQAGKSMTPGVSLLNSRELQSVDANFRGIDIPLNLVYNINKNLYTAVGVSYFNVISEDRKDTFVSGRQVSASATDPVTGLAANTRRLELQTTQEPATETLLNGKSYLGFFNFSIGRKQELFKKYNIFIEPFIKVPVGKLSQQELKMTNGGMKFKVAF